MNNARTIGTKKQGTPLKKNMSRHNKKRRRWKCGKCKMPMWAEFKKPAQQIAAEHHVSNRVVHVCGACKAMHFVEGDKLRLVTPGEEFQLRVAHSRMIDEFERRRFEPTDHPEASVFISKERS